MTYVAVAKTTRQARHSATAIHKTPQQYTLTHDA
ncbi:hypothetical protein B0G77_0110 [Paraburkholderia sp. BL10I2N1]|nr:hypothetical protein B0G77_0110 [Paraburkholderia sp. BL10I2N1]